MIPRVVKNQSRETNSAFGRIVRGFGIHRPIEQKESNMESLLKGVETFKQTYFSERRELFEQLACGQNPQTLFITCSDSRIDPNLLTQTSPGELFVLRNAGNLVPRYEATTAGGESATIEYAVSVLKVSDIVICGHSDCGAMKALLQPENLSGLPAVASWLEHARPAALDQVSSAISTSLLHGLIERNVLTQVRNLMTHPSVAKRVSDGDLRINGWVLDIASGSVSVHDLSQGRFVPAAPDNASSAGA
jgi:carbonic anhydrase